jgi:hypothetical protein
MSFTLRHTDEFGASVRDRDLNATQLAELRFRLKEDLTEDPWRHLRPIKNDPDYMEYAYESQVVVEGERSLFAFRVQVSMDEETLLILEGDRVTCPDE